MTHIDDIRDYYSREEQEVREDKNIIDRMRLVEGEIRYLDDEQANLWQTVLDQQAQIDELEARIDDLEEQEVEEGVIEDSEESTETDVSGMQALMKLQQVIDETPVFVGYIYGTMGAGRTDFALLLLDMFEVVYGADSVYTASNITGDFVDDEVTKSSRVVELLEERRDRIREGEELDKLVILIDEAAQHSTEQLSNLIRIAQKSNAHILVIGDDGRKIDDSLRALCTTFIEKKEKKQATLYQDMEDREGLSEVMSLHGLPATSLDYSTYDDCEFTFDDEDECNCWESVDAECAAPEIGHCIGEAAGEEVNKGERA